MLAWFMFKSFLKVACLCCRWISNTTHSIRLKIENLPGGQWLKSIETKAKEEYASSQFQDAEALVAEAILWMNNTADVARLEADGTQSQSVDADSDGAEK